MDEWKRGKGDISVIKKVMLSCDVTDYGLNNFEQAGAYTASGHPQGDLICGGVSSVNDNTTDNRF